MKMQDVLTRKEVYYFKVIGCIGVLLGVCICLCMGKEAVLELELLDVQTLMGIRDESLEGSSFLQYILAKRMLIFVLGAVLWWWGFSKIYWYGIWLGYAASIGICFYISLLRYPFSGLFLWFFLYMPHSLCYIAALICAVLLAAGRIKGREEKILYLWKHKVLLFGGIFCYVVGIYCESYIHITLLQHFLQYF